VIIYTIKDACNKSLAYLEENLLGGDNKSKSKATNSNDMDSYDNIKNGSKRKTNEDNNEQVHL
jgi:hypothetical protein